jgi:hypothetical protein
MIHRYDAPAGFVAVRGVIGTCSNCSYKNECKEPKYCCSDSRKDGESVMFKTRDEFEKMLLAEVEAFYGEGKVERITFKKDNIKQNITLWI